MYSGGRQRPRKAIEGAEINVVSPALRGVPIDQPSYAQKGRKTLKGRKIEKMAQTLKVGEGSKQKRR